MDENKNEIKEEKEEALSPLAKNNSVDTYRHLASFIRRRQRRIYIHRFSAFKA